MEGLIDQQCPFCSVDEENPTPCWGILFPEDDVGTDVIWNGSAFRVIIDTAPLVAGHLLIATKEHLTSLARCSNQDWVELAEIKSRVTNALSSLYARPTFLEHGAADSSMRAGACVDHAHLHAIPGQYDILGLLVKDFPEVARYATQTEALRVFAETPYLYYEDTDGRIFGTPAPYCSTQYLRQLVANASGIPERWNWRHCISHAVHMGIIDEVRTTITQLATYLNGN